MREDEIQELQPYPLDVKVGDTVVDWQVRYFQSDDPKEYKGKVVATSKPPEFTRDSGGYGWPDCKAILVKFGDGEQFVYPVGEEHYLAKKVLV